MNMQLLYVNLYGIVIDRAQYEVALSHTDEDSRRIIIARVEDAEKSSGIRFKSFDKCQTTFYEPATQSFRQMRVLKIKVAAPEDISPTDIGMYFLNLIK